MLRGKRDCPPVPRVSCPFLSSNGGRVMWPSWPPRGENLGFSGRYLAWLDVSVSFLQAEEVSFLYHPCAHPWLKLQLALLAHVCGAQPALAPDSSLTQDRVSGW